MAALAVELAAAYGIPWPAGTNRPGSPPWDVEPGSVPENLPKADRPRPVRDRSSAPGHRASIESLPATSKDARRSAVRTWMFAAARSMVNVKSSP